GLYHMMLNLIAVLLFAINFGLRMQDFREATTVAGVPLGLSFIGTALLIGSAYLGGRMVYTYGISVARMSKAKWRKIAEAGGANLPPEERQAMFKDFLEGKPMQHPLHPIRVHSPVGPLPWALFPALAE